MALCEILEGERWQRFALPLPLIDLVRLCDGTRSIAQVADRFRADGGGAWTDDEISSLIARQLVPKRLIVGANDDAPARTTLPKDRARYIYLKLQLVPPAAVQAVARYLHWCFERPAVVAGIAVFVAAHLYFYGVLGGGAHLSMRDVDGGGFLLIIVLSTLAGLVHEFGHATAASRFGCRRAAIGWGVYIVFTVLWTDVSEVWRLPRRQRAIVDVAGMYFQSAVLVGLLAAYAVTHRQIWLLAFLVIDIEVVANLNPFLRMDGYWLVSDWFGIPDLREQQLRWLRSLGLKMIGRDPGPARPRPVARSTALVIAIYTALAVVFLVVALRSIVQNVVVELITAYPGMLRAYWAEVMHGASAWTLAAGAVELAWRGIVFVGLGMLVWRILRMLGRAVRAWTAQMVGRAPVVPPALP
jgi:putative peptide zinc metalloprotease protein